jgi:glycosyltransferase involved in cell wall biosynthesis
MYQTIRELSRLCDLHLIVLLDYPRELTPHQPIKELCRSVEFIVRMEGRQKELGVIEPHAVREFRNPDLEWLIHRQILTKDVDVLQLEYTVMAQYAGGYRRIPSIVFEHDVYFQSIARGLPFMKVALQRIQARWEYLRALRYELKQLPKADRIQVSSSDNRNLLESFLPNLKGKIDDHLRAGIDTSNYDFRAGGREPDAMLFLGSFRHLPNQEAIDWLLRRVLPRVQERRPQARLVVVGSDPPPRHFLPASATNVELVGFVPDVREPLSRYALFLCPILSGSGVRVKLLEAFAAGIPAVSTRLGAEGLTAADGDICALADDPEEFADRIVDLLESPDKREEMAIRARRYVLEYRDMSRMTQRLADSYRNTVAAMRSGISTRQPLDLSAEPPLAGVPADKVAH